YGSGTENKFFFDNSKAAFRAGGISNKFWDIDSLGQNSFASGNNTKAIGTSSTAFGKSTRATGASSTSLGESTTASGTNSTAMGIYSNATGSYAISAGFNASSSGNTSLATGLSTTASGDYSTSMGGFTDAIGSYSTATGDYTSAVGFAAFSSGFKTEANGDISAAFGDSTIAESYGEFVVGSFDTDYTPNDATNYNAADRVFVVGNGTSSARSDALIIYKNGNMDVNGNLDINDGSITLSQKTGVDADNLSTNGKNSVIILNADGAGANAFPTVADGTIIVVVNTHTSTITVGGISFLTGEASMVVRANSSWYKIK
ncbi:MAG: hypothetical protein RIF34_08360, partial [Candidatus Kapaibacterium sp.]